MDGSMKAVILACLLYNALTAILTWADKKAAGNGKRRLPERRLLLFAVTGGGAGVLAACYLFCHKTKKKLLLNQIWFLTLFSYMLLVTLHNRFLR